MTGLIIQYCFLKKVKSEISSKLLGCETERTARAKNVHELSNCDNKRSVLTDYDQQSRCRKECTPIDGARTKLDVIH
jgi:hypothetical protein